MEDLKISSGPSGQPKEKHVATCDRHPSISRTASCNSHLNTKIRYARRDSTTKSRQPDQNGTSGLTDWCEVSEKLPAVVVNGKEDVTVEEEPLPPPEVTSASVMAMIRLEGSLSDLKEAIRMYEEFDRICDGKHQCFALSQYFQTLTLAKIHQRGLTSWDSKFPIFGTA